MDKRTPHNIEALFLEIVELPEADRSRALDDRCGIDVALRAHVERLLRADEANARDASLERPIAHWSQTQMPARVGGYRITGIAGEGGSGTVFDAVHESTRRRAAIKLIRTGLTTAHGRQRLAIEAETLGRLNHEGIARLYEAGIADISWLDAAPSRSPFIAMEFIENAISVTQFARDKSLSPRESIKLIALVSRAVHHAHQRGVIHRDLKPGNLLVNLVTGVPKIVDFGIARVTDVDLTSVTQTGQVLGTLRYMSPEQAAADPTNIDARTDIYSLGAMLYELLSGRPVIDTPSSSSAAVLAQLINTDPPRLASINRDFRGDLDAIVHKSIQRDPDDRYTSAAALADDLDRYLEGREVSARAPTPAEQVVRFVKRNKTTTAAVALVLLSITAGAVAATWGLFQADRARREEARQRTIAEAQTIEAQNQKAEAERQRIEADRRREEAEAVTSFLTVDILSQAGPASLPDKAVRDTIVQKLIDPAAQTVGQRFKDKPLVEAAVRSSIGATYHELGRSDLAATQLSIALETHRRLLGDDHTTTLWAMNALARAAEQLGDLDQAEALYREALERRRRVLGPDERYTLLAANNLGLLLLNRGNLAEAVPLLEDSLRRLEAQGQTSQDAILPLLNLAFVKVSQDRLAEAEVLQRKALAISRNELGDDHPTTILALGNLANTLQRQNKLDEAERLSREEIERSVRVLGSDHPRTIVSRANLSFVLQYKGRLEEASTVMADALAANRAALGDDHPMTIRLLAELASQLERQGKLHQAEPMSRDALRRGVRILGELHETTVIARTTLTTILQTQRRLGEAEAILGPALLTSRSEFGDDHPDTIRLLNDLAWVLEQQNKLEEAEPLGREAVERGRRVLGERDRATITATVNLASLLLKRGRLEEAESLMLLAVHARRATLGDDDPVTLQTVSGLARIQRQRGNLAGALALTEEALARAKADPALGPEHATTKTIAAAYADCLDALNRLADAAAVRAEYEIPPPAATQPTPR